MTSMFAPPPFNLSDRILCYYVNLTNQIQRACISNTPNGLYERVVFPQQRLLFEAVTGALLDVYVCSPGGETLLDRIPCLALKVNEGDRRTPAIAGITNLTPQTNLVEE